MDKYYGVSKVVKTIKDGKMLKLKDLTYSDIFDVEGILDAETGRYLCDVGDIEDVISEKDIPECKRIVWQKADTIITYNILILHSDYFIEHEKQKDIKDLIIKAIEGEEITSRDIPLSLSHLRLEVDLVDGDVMERNQTIMDILIADEKDEERKLNLLVLNTFAILQRPIYYMMIKIMNPGLYKLLKMADYEIQVNDSKENEKQDADI